MKKKHILATAIALFAIPVLSACEITTYDVHKIVWSKEVEIKVPACFLDQSYQYELADNFENLNLAHSTYQKQTVNLVRVQLKRTPYIFFPTVAHKYFEAHIDKVDFEGFKRVATYYNNDTKPTFDSLSWETSSKAALKRILKNINSVSFDYQPIKYQFRINYPRYDEEYPGRTVYSRIYYYKSNVMDIQFPKLEEIYGDINAKKITSRGVYLSSSYSSGAVFADYENRVMEAFSVLDNNRYSGYIPSYGEGSDDIRYIDLYPALYLKNEYSVYDSDFSFSANAIVSDYNYQLPYEAKNDYQFDAYYLDPSFTKRVNTINDLPVPTDEEPSIELYPRYIAASDNLSYDADNVVSSDSEGDLIIPDIHNNSRVTVLGQFKNAKSLSCPRWINTLSAGAFINNSNIINFDIPQKVTDIPANCFSGCTRLMTVTNMDNISSIGDNAFKACVSLSSFTMPKVDYTLGRYVFDSCTNISEFTGGGTYDGVLYYDHQIYCYPALKADNSYVFPNYVTSLQTYAFKNNQNLQEVTFTCDNMTFNDYCLAESKVTTLRYAGSEATLSRNAFYDTPRLIYIYLLSDYINIESNVFNDLSAIPDMFLKSGSTSFDRVNNYLSDSAYCYSCGNTGSCEDGIYSYNYDGQLTAVVPFGNEIRLPYGSTSSVASNALGVNFNIKTITIGEGITHLSDKAFSGAKGLVSVYIPGESFVSIDGNPFPLGGSYTIYIKNSSIFSEYLTQWSQYSSCLRTY